MSYASLIGNWREQKTEDLILEKELDFPDEKIEQFFKNQLVFGTAGIRGKMGAGTNKINVHTIAAAAKAYADYIISKDSYKKGIVIGHDNRHNSKLFTLETARVLMNNGIKAFICEENELKPTPFISFTIRNLNLSGGIIITASHNPKEYNGFKVYNSKGGQLMPSETKEIQKIMAKIDPLKVVKSSQDPAIISNDLEKDYIRDVLKLRKLQTSKSITIAFSAQHGTSAKMAPKILEMMGHKVFVENKQQIPDPDFKYTKTPNPEDGKAYRRVTKLARKHKTDLILTTDPDADRLGAAVRYQKRYKFLNGNQMATLYLEYLLTTMKRNGTLPKDGYIATTVVSSSLPEKIANKFGVKVVKTHVGFKNIADIIDKTKGTYLFGFEESYGFLIDPNIARDKDSFQAMVGLAEMVAYYKSQNINAYSHLKDIYSQYGIHRTVQISKKIDEKQQRRLFKALMNSKRIGQHKIVNKFDWRKGLDNLPPQNLVKIEFDNGSWLAVRPSGTEPKVKVYVETIGKPSQQLIDIVAFEKEVAEFVDDSVEEFEDKKWSWKGFTKYSIFLGIIALIMVFVFMFVYKSSNDSTTKVFSVFTSLYHSVNVGLWLSIWVWLFFLKFVGAWAKKRMFDQLGVKVKLRHIFISQVMGAIIAFVTPFAIGGDAIGYWYLRRKGVKRAPLIATLASATVWVELKYALQTVFLFAIGFNFYIQIFDNSNPQAHAALIMFFIGFAWGIFSSGMIFTLAVSKRIQEFIVRNSVKFLEWMPWYHVTDPGLLSAGVQRQFMLVRNGTKKIWVKPLFVLEMLVYDIVPMFFSPMALIYANSGLINPDVASGTYWSQIVANDISGTANSMSITPGGSGTYEWLSVNINENLFKNTPLASSAQFGEPKQVAAASDFLNKIIYNWPDLILSSLIIFLAVLTVRRKPLKFLKGRRAFVFSGMVLSSFILGLLLLMFLI